MASINKAFFRRLIDFSPITAPIRASVVGPAWILFVDIVNAVRRHKVSMLARQAAYSLLYAVPSAIVLIVALANLIDSRTGSNLFTTLSTFIDERAPAEMKDLLDEILRQALVETSTNQASVAAAISVLVAIWGGASGTGALVFACNDVYDVGDKRNFFVKKFMTLALTIIQGVVVVSALILFTLGNYIAGWLERETGASANLIRVLASGRLVSAGLLFISLYLLYFVAPDVEKTFRWLLPGTVLAALGVVLFFALLDNLLRVLDPVGAYDIAGSVLILLWFLYLISLMIVYGAVLNAVLGERYDWKLKNFLKEHPERRIRDSQGIEHPEGTAEAPTAA